ncbi:MAG TPA: PIN domain-containing protein, partial [Gemmataceae bacterium]|nr:PIN domain-containing protein [Gemmataceae bacterium]
MPAVVIDTDVVSFTFKKDTRARQYRRHLVGRTLVISFMTLAELHAWALQRRWGRARRDQLTRHVGRYAVHYADHRLCERWAEVMDQARLKGRPIGVADTWIAATA